MASSTTSGRAAAGSASITKPLFQLKYDETMTANLESGAFTNPGDLMVGLNVLDTTTAHELAHRVDRRDRYSHKPSFLALSGWKHYPRGKERPLVAAMEAEMPLPASLSAREKKLALNSAERSVRKRRDIVGPDMADDLDKAYIGLGLKKAGRSTGSRAYNSSSALFSTLSATPLFLHVAAGHESNQPWSAEPFSYLPNKQFHEAYPNRGWWEYSSSSRATKLSWYQFRDPGEEFGELYATYHLGTPKGSGVPLAMKTWFEEQGLHL